MNALPVVLDSAGLSAASEAKPPARLRALLAEAYARGSDVIVPAVICAEVCRGVARTRGVETLVTRKLPDNSGNRAIALAETDFTLARQVGAVLAGAGVGSEYIADAHVVAVCAQHGGGMVITSDPHDITRLAATVPSARIVVRAPD
ncbi:type II toxin-antitoxin system VapC family toxin [Nocardia sp. NPDC058640]|uniref:type II toxin-antitoxin system VapC family toxin n=1 Tax=Nocardia sp. NPDC058640 TaxID=3346571 RepID=UPI00366989BC